MLFTVVTPVLNGIDYLPGCIESVRAQSGDGIEVEHIVVDGDSTDGSAAYAEQQGCRVMGREKPSVTFAINKGVAHARGEVVSMLGCDDRLMPGGLALVRDKLEAEGRRWAISACRWLDPAGRPLGDQPAGPPWMTASILSCLGWNCVPHVAMFMRPELHHELGDLDERFTYAPDYELACRALAAGHEFSRIPQAAAASMRHGDNLSMQRSPDHLAELEEIERMYGPGSALARMWNRYLLKVWLNAGNLKWFWGKHGLQLGIDPQKPGALKSPHG
jgi:glycosyltransferase involved in cell wall biosynthesis